MPFIADFRDTEGSCGTYIVDAYNTQDENARFLEDVETCKDSFDDDEWIAGELVAKLRQKGWKISPYTEVVEIAI